MEFKRKNIRFTIPDVITVRQQMEYVGAATVFAPSERYTRWWEAAKTLIQEWECKLISDFKELNIDEETNGDIADILIWAGIQVWNHLNNIGQTPKN